MADGALTKKLLVKPGQRITVINPPPDYVNQLGPLPEGVELADRPERQFDLVHLFVKNVEELDRLAQAAIGAVKRDGILWISYPKQRSKVKTDITRDVGWGPLLRAGLRPVTEVSIDEAWSALRFRPVEAVGKIKKEHQN